MGGQGASCGQRQGELAAGPRGAPADTCGDGVPAGQSSDGAAPRARATPRPIPPPLPHAAPAPAYGRGRGERGPQGDRIADGDDVLLLQ